MIQKTLHRKLKIERGESNWNGVNSYAPKR